MKKNIIDKDNSEKKIIKKNLVGKHCSNHSVLKKKTKKLNSQSAQ
jgi:hypothetical protein